MSDSISCAPLGLVLEGGAMRGIYTAGVLDVFLENDLLADVVIGVSAGALHGCSYVSGQRGRSIRYYEKYRGDRRFMGLWPLLTTGEAVGKKFCYEDIPLRLDPFDEAAFEASPIVFYVTVTNVETGRAEYLRCDDLRLDGKMDVIRAGASMPLVSHMVEYSGRLYLDGGVADSIPLAAARRLGCQKNIVVLTQPEGYLKQPASLAPFQLAYAKYPNFVKAVENRSLVYNSEVCLAEQGAREGSVFLIRPSQPLHVGRMERDIHKLRALYELGRRDTEALLPGLLRFAGKPAACAAGTRPSV